MRGYTDFTLRSPVPYRDGDSQPLQFTHRRTQQLINAAGNGFGAFSSYHSDGEFTGKSEHENLIKLINTTFVSRNMGWRPGEEELAASLRLRFILEDNIPAGSRENTNPSYIEQFCRSYGMEKREFLQLDGNKILELSAEAVAYYIEQIRSDIDSPFDRFLEANDIADHKIADENTLRSLLQKKSYVFIDTVVPVESEIIADRKIKFGKNELEGLRIFMDRQKANCVSCHTPPEFTDKRFHNIGVSEFDYMDIHGVLPGNFYNKENLIKTLQGFIDINELQSRYQVYPKLTSKESIDLGHALFTSKPEENISAFRTPTLRNLQYCDPYLHSGRAGTVKKAVEFHYLAASFRNNLPYLSKELPDAKLTPRELELLVMFLKTLNDHYE
jgi:cytochrome c peroxidase